MHWASLSPLLRCPSSCAHQTRLLYPARSPVCHPLVDAGAPVFFPPGKVQKPPIQAPMHSCCRVCWMDFAGFCFEMSIIRKLVLRLSLCKGNWVVLKVFDFSFAKPLSDWLSCSCSTHAKTGGSDEHEADVGSRAV